MNRRTSHYRLVVAVPELKDDRAAREQAITALARALPTGVKLAGSCYTPDSVEISYRATDDLQAISIAQSCLSWANVKHEAHITTGYGVHKRRVAEQVAR